MFTWDTTTNLWSTSIPGDFSSRWTSYHIGLYGHGLVAGDSQAVGVWGGERGEEAQEGWEHRKGEEEWGQKWRGKEGGKKTGGERKQRAASRELLPSLLLELVPTIAPSTPSLLSCHLDHCPDAPLNHVPQSAWEQQRSQWGEVSLPDYSWALQTVPPHLPRYSLCQLLQLKEEQRGKGAREWGAAGKLQGSWDDQGGRWVICSWRGLMGERRIWGPVWGRSWDPSGMGGAPLPLLSCTYFAATGSGAGMEHTCNP